MTRWHLYPRSMQVQCSDKHLNCIKSTIQFTETVLCVNRVIVGLLCWFIAPLQRNSTTGTYIQLTAPFLHRLLCCLYDMKSQ